MKKMSEMASFSASFSPSRLWQILAGILLIPGVWIGWNLYADYVATGLQERTGLTKQTQVVNENLEHQLIATHHTLNAIRAELPKLLAQRDGLTLLKQRLQIMRDAMPTTRAITVFDAQGTLIARSPDQFAGQNFSQRDYFQIARQGGNASTLYVAPPFLAATKEYVLNMSKVVLNAQGDFDGIVLVSLGPEYFSTLLRSVLYAPDMRSELIHASGKLVFQAPAQKKPDATGLLAQPDAFFTRHMETGQASSVFEGGTTSGGEERADRLMIFRTIQPAAVSMDRPLVFVVSRDIAALFAPWRTDLLVQASLYVLLVLASTLGMYSWQRRRREYERLVAEQEAQREQVAEILYKQAEALTLSNAELTRLGEAMAHHFQEPARRLASFTQRLLARSDLVQDEDSRLSLNFINAESRRLSLLVAEAQRYLALDHGNISTTNGVDSGVVLRQCIAHTDADANADIVLHEPLPPVRLHEKLLRELFVILLDNALRYRHAQRRLHMDVSASTQGERVVFRFADNGSGIAPEYRTQVLQLFTRLVPSSIPGTGMGLALANKIIHIVGGHLHIEDGLDGGACIVFDLPLDR